MAHVLVELDDARLKSGLQGALSYTEPGVAPSRATPMVYVELQVHGPIDFATHVASTSAPGAARAHEGLLLPFAERTNTEHLWY